MTRSRRPFNRTRLGRSSAHGLAALLLALGASACVDERAPGDAPDGADASAPADTFAPADTATAPPLDAVEPGDTDGTPADATPPADTAPPSDAAAPTDTTTDTTAPPVVTHTVTIGPFSVPSGVEATMCATVDLGNAAPGVIRAIRTRLDPGSHHLIVHRLSDTPEPTPKPCGAFAHGMGQQVLFIAQQREAGLAYPDGAGLTVPAHQTIGLEMHYINYFASDQVDITGTVEFDLAPTGTAVDEVRVLFTGSLGFTIPAESEYTHSSYFPASSGWEVFGMTSHTHQLGTRATIHLAQGANDPSPTLLHESTDWAEPPLTLFDPLLQISAGQGLRLTCEFDNPNPHPVSFGLGFEDEMCFLWLYYIE